MGAAAMMIIGMIGVSQPTSSCERGLLDLRCRDLSTGIMSERPRPVLVQ